MAIIDMQRVSLLGLQRQREAILGMMQGIGVVQITDVELPDEQADSQIGQQTGLHTISATVALDEQRSRLASCLAFFKQYAPVKKSLLQSLSAETNTISTARMAEIMAAQEDVWAVVEQCQRFDEQLSEIRSNTTRLQNQLLQLQSWEELELPLEQLAPTRFTQQQLVVVPTLESDIWEAALSEGGVAVRKISEGKGQSQYYILFHKENLSAVETAHKKGHAAPLQLRYTGTVREVMQDCQKQIDDLALQRETILEAIVEQSVHREEVEVLWDVIGVFRERAEASERLLHTESAFVLEGWVPEKRVNYLTESLNKVTQDYVITFRPPYDDEDFPVATQNPAIVQPFEMITNLYGTPACRSVDPNPYMAPFYALFFGMMVGDAGYGLIMAVLCLAGLAKLKPKGGMKQLLGILALGGVSTFIWGVLFGSWFGIETPPLLGIAPMSSPLPVLGLCFGLGIVHLFTGMIIKTRVQLKEGAWADALNDNILWMTAIIGLIMMAGQMLGDGFALISKIGMYMALVSTAGLIILGMRGKKNPIMAFFSGILNLYAVTGFLSDILSYARLFALGLSTGVIGMVVNTAGAMLGNSWFTVPIMIVIFIGGHIFNLVMNALGAYVHTSRLQYIEFFGKFYEGGGKGFKPLGIKTKYIEIR